MKNKTKRRGDGREIPSTSTKGINAEKTVCVLILGAISTSHLVALEALEGVL